MYLIKIDSTKRYEKSVKLVSKEKDNETVVDSVEGDLDIVSTIKNLVEKNNLKITDIGEVISAPGPGSFTGLKIGSTIANVINWALGRKKVEELEFPDYGKEPNITLKR